jgi:hypothetical protein
MTKVVEDKRRSIVEACVGEVGQILLSSVKAGKKLIRLLELGDSMDIFLLLVPMLTFLLASGLFYNRFLAAITELKTVVVDYNSASNAGTPAVRNVRLNIDTVDLKDPALPQYDIIISIDALGANADRSVT